MNIPESLCFKQPESNVGWHAELKLKFGIKRFKTRLLERQQYGPLTVQKTFHPAGTSCHTYLLHPPGGVVGGDHLNFVIDVEESAHALLTTPGATKFYRSSGEQAWQKQQLNVANHGLLEWLPMENIFFPGARCKLLTHINLAAHARFIGWDIQCFGRPVLEEKFDDGEVLGQTFIFREQEICLSETVRVQTENRFEPTALLRDFAMLGTLYITPVDHDLIDKITRVVERQQQRFGDGVLLGITELKNISECHSLAVNSAVNNLVVVRALGHQTEPMIASFIQIWCCVREHWFGELPEIPRIWAT
ncbi:urease accessory protein UreD [Photobacterium leiognathi]|uniref:urease accessory protein UreD n=1 Tax=Photobacterium leiognathi TaxID=553611 RepID=UPI000769CFD4|nr:urease accessory protein UreD [Photobacterium leiognathi]